MSKYKCIKKCYYLDRLWSVGEVIDSDKEDEVIKKRFAPIVPGQSAVPSPSEEPEPKTFHEMNEKQVQAEKDALPPDAEASKSKVDPAKIDAAAEVDTEAVKEITEANKWANSSTPAPGADPNPDVPPAPLETEEEDIFA